MLTFKQYLAEDLITFGKKAYPKYGQFVILAGGSGSGKGWIKKNLLGISAKSIDVDHLKELVLKSDKLRAPVDQKHGYKVTKKDLKNPDVTSSIHAHVTQKGYDKKQLVNLQKGIDQTQFLPNLIFDNTLDSIQKLHDLCSLAARLGYRPENIHLVWVVNDYLTALDQNSKRERSVPNEIVMQKHVGVALTMKEIYSSLPSLSAILNGDVWFVFNKAGVDSVYRESDSKKSGYVSKSTYIKVKESGSSRVKSLPDNLELKLRQYTPTGWK